MMMSKNKILHLAIALLVALSVAMIGCSGGSSPNSTLNATSPTPSLKVVPANYDFRTVTEGNFAQPLEVSIQNAGNATLKVEDISLSGTGMAHFKLDLNWGANPCESPNPTIGPGNSCNVAIEFSPSLSDIFNADLVILSNDLTSPTYRMPLSGTKEDILTVNLRISQIEACPRPIVTTYVSVTDQGGFSVIGLNTSNFTLRENSGAAVMPGTADFVDETVNLSVALLMDYSGSISINPEDVEKMEKAAIHFINQMGENDEAEIIKFATTYELSQEFTSSTEDLIAAILSEPDVGQATLLYDTIVKAVEDTKNGKNPRKAIIVITDGVDHYSPSVGPASENSIEEVIDQANEEGIPVYTVGLGDQVDPESLQRLAAETGGNFYGAPTPDNLITIHQQLADLLFKRQYILTYESDMLGGSTGILEVTVDVDGILGSDTKAIPACVPVP